MSGHHLEVIPLERGRWIVRYEGDTAPLSERATRADAIAEARNWARQFGERVIHITDRDGEHHTEEIHPDFRAPTPADVKGPHVEP
jgi:hypothetical protein